jgi:hypothetical protein
VFCTPPPPPVVGGGDDNDVDWVARGLSSSGDGSIVASTLRWSLASLSPSGGDRGGAGRLAEFLVGVRRTSLEARRYRVGWTRLGAGGRKRRVAAVAAGPRTGSLGQGVSSGVAGDGDGRGLDDWTTTRRMPPRHVSERGVSPPATCRSSRPVTERDGSEGGD